MLQPPLNIMLSTKITPLKECLDTGKNKQREIFMKKLLLVSALAGAVFLSPLATAADYVIDYKGSHASVNF